MVDIVPVVYTFLARFTRAEKPGEERPKNSKPIDQVPLAKEFVTENMKVE